MQPSRMACALTVPHNFIQVLILPNLNNAEWIHRSMNINCLRVGVRVVRAEEHSIGEELFPGTIEIPGINPPG